MEQMKSQGLGESDYELWDGVFLPSIKASINAAHKQIVRYAQLAEWEEVCIVEDDLIFTSPNSWRYFLDHKPTDYDIYLSMIYLGEIDENNIVKDFTGLTLYVVMILFYPYPMTTIWIGCLVDWGGTWFVILLSLNRATGLAVIPGSGKTMKIY
jgi:hypothetical protein